MPSETFYCPHCKNQLTKSAQHYVMGESSYFIGLGGLSPEVICPACGGKIDTVKMIKGEYDTKNVINKGSSTGCAVTLFAIFVIVSLVFCLYQNIHVNLTKMINILSNNNYFA